MKADPVQVIYSASKCHLISKITVVFGERRTHGEQTVVMYI